MVNITMPLAQVLHLNQWTVALELNGIECLTLQKRNSWLICEACGGLDLSKWCILIDQLVLFYVRRGRQLLVQISDRVILQSGHVFIRGLF